MHNMRILHKTGQPPTGWEATYRAVAWPISKQRKETNNSSYLGSGNNKFDQRHAAIIVGNVNSCFDYSILASEISCRRNRRIS